MKNNKFCIFQKKTLKNIEMGNSPSYFIIYKNKEREYKHHNKNFKSKNSYIDYTFIRNYNLSMKNLSKYKKNINILRINNLLKNKKCNFCAIYNDIKIYSEIETDYIKKYYNYNDSIKIIPKRQAYFKHLMIYIESPVYKSFIYNKIIKKKGLDKLNLYKRTNYPKKKFHKKSSLYINNQLSDSNIIFNTNVIETIENCTTSLTQCSNMKNNIIIKSENNEKNNINESLISEIKFNNELNNKKNNNSNISSGIDNSLLMMMKDLSISRNIINKYLCKHNDNYKQLFNKMKSKSKTITIINNNIKQKEEKEPNKIKNNYENNNNEIKDNKSQYIKKNENKSIKNIKHNKNGLRDSISLIKKLNKMKTMQINLINLKSSSQIDKNCNNNLNSCTNFNKYGLSLGKQNQINNNIRNNNKKLSCKGKSNFHFNYFNKSNKDKSKEKKVDHYFSKKKDNFKLNNKMILKSIKKIIENKRPKNNSLKKYINTQKLLTDSSNYCLLDMNSLNENETKKMFQTINPVKSISISNNQFFKYIKDFKK